MKYTFSLFFIALFLFTASARAQAPLINTVAGNGTSGFGGDGSSAFGATLFGPIGVAVDSSGNVYVLDFYNKRVRRVDAGTGIITTVAGNGGGGYSGDNSYGANAQVSPSGIAVDKHGNLYIADGTFGVIRKVNKTNEIITTVVGTGIMGYSGDGGAATAAQLNQPEGITFDDAGNLYIADYSNNVIRMVDTFGMISTVAGEDSIGYSGDGFAATTAKLDSPYAVAVDRHGNLYISDFQNNVIRKVDDTGTITTFAGVNALPPAYLGNGGPATAAQLNHARGIATDYYGNLYIADAGNNVIRKVDTFGNITTVAGNGTPGFGGDLGFATGANLFNPYGVTVDYRGNMYIADANNERVRVTYFANEGVKNTAQNTAIAVHPNPFTSKVTVLGLAKGDKVCVYDVAGRQVSNMLTAVSDGAQTISINDLASGVYMLQVWDGQGNKKAVAQLVKE